MKNNKSVPNWKAKFFQLMKEAVITHLEGISNQELNVPIPNSDDISVKDLITEVEKESLVGVKYMVEYAKTVALIVERRKK